MSKLNNANQVQDQELDLVVGGIVSYGYGDPYMSSEEKQAGNEWAKEHGVIF